MASIALITGTAGAATISSSTHPGGFFYEGTTAAGDCPIVPYQAPGGVPADVDVKPNPDGLNFVNKAPGSFGVTFKITPYDASQLGVMTFDYKLNPDDKIDLFFKVGDSYYGALFNGPGSVRPGAVLLGRIPDVVADGNWHTAVVPLRSWLVRTGATKFDVEEMLAGNWNNTGYLLAGIGGNGPGATWSLRNLELMNEGPLQAKFQLQGARAWDLDGGKRQPVPEDGVLSLSAAPGYHLIKAFDASGKMIGAYPFDATAPPSAGKPFWRGNDIIVPLDEGTGLDPANFKLTVDGVAVGLDSPLLGYDSVAHELVYQAGNSKVSWPDGSSVPISLSGFTDHLGRGPGSQSLPLDLHYADHTTLPPAPQVHLVSVPDMGDGTFETDTDGWTGVPAGSSAAAIVERVTDSGAPTNFALRLTCAHSATPFGVSIRQDAFDATQFPVIAFDYKVPDRLRMDFHLDWDGKSYDIQFMDRDNPLPRLGSINNITSNNAWHRGEIPLLDWMKAARPGATDFTVSNLGADDEGWLGNSRGVQWYVAHWDYVPALKGGSAQVQCDVRDVTGIKAVAWTLDTLPDTLPDKQPVPSNRFIIKGNGRMYLHVRVQDGAGIWGPAAHVPVDFLQADGG